METHPIKRPGNDALLSNSSRGISERCEMSDNVCEADDPCSGREPCITKFRVKRGEATIGVECDMFRTQRGELLQYEERLDDELAPILACVQKDVSYLAYLGGRVRLEKHEGVTSACALMGVHEATKRNLLDRMCSTRQRRWRVERPKEGR